MLISQNGSEAQKSTIWWKSSLRGFWFLVFAALNLWMVSGQEVPAGIVTGQEIPAGIVSEQPLWRRALGGKIDAYPAQGPGGDVYVVADDRALHSLNPETGESNWIYRPGGRLRNLLMVAADGTIYLQNDRQELFAVSPGGTGRWKLNMRREMAALPAASPDGRVIVALTGGRILAVSRHGTVLWFRDDSAEASAGPVVDSAGVAWVPLSDGRILALDHYGDVAVTARVSGAPSVMALDGLGRLWVGCFDGSVGVFDAAGPISREADSPDIGGESPLMEALFTFRPSDARVVSILTGPDGDGLVFLADGKTVDCSPDGVVANRSGMVVSGGAPSAAGDGTVFLPASDGSIRVVPVSGESLVLRAPSVLAEPLLSAEGVLIAGGGDWILYAWQAAPPGEGWRQFRGDSRRGGTFPVAPVIYDRVQARKEPGFFFREQAAVSDDVSERLALVRELEAYSDIASMKRDLPWVDLILEDLVAVGTTRRVNRQNEPLQSHPVVRIRGYRLLGSSEDFRTRDLLLRTLAKEEDQAALAEGFRALGRLGSDYDGASLRLISARFNQMVPVQERLVLETARALADLVLYNGDISDPAGYELMNRLLLSPVSESTRNEVISIIREVASLQR